MVVFVVVLLVGLLVNFVETFVVTLVVSFAVTFLDVLRFIGDPLVAVAVGVLSGLMIHLFHSVLCMSCLGIAQKLEDRRLLCVNYH